MAVVAVVVAAEGECTTAAFSVVGVVVVDMVETGLERDGVVIFAWVIGTRGGNCMVAGGLRVSDASLAGLGRGDRVTLGHKCIVRSSTSSGNKVLNKSASLGGFPDIKIRWSVTGGLPGYLLVNMTFNSPIDIVLGTS